MPRLRRSQLPDGIVHVTTRGVFERAIFLDDLDRLMFLALLVLVARRHGWKLHAYCLMGTHYHLVVETSIVVSPRACSTSTASTHSVSTPATSATVTSSGLASRRGSSTTTTTTSAPSSTS